jgi:GSH-dependent disulfide-bond oxidoreductase
MSILDDYMGSSDDAKCELLREIEFEEIPEKWALIRAVIANKDEYDLARVQALKILEIAGLPAEDLQSFGELLVTVITTDTDDVVRNYAVIASKNFVNDCDELKQLIIKIVLDPKEGIDIRHNACSAVMAFFDLPRRKAVLEQLSSDKHMGEHAKGELAEYHGSSEDAPPAAPSYTPPKVWTWNKPNGGEFSVINRPIAGPTHEKVLPVGRHPLQLYSQGTPNGQKVTILLEELLALGHAGAEYDAWLIRIKDGDQFGSGFVAVNPNSKIPALLDRSGPEPIRVFESGAILLYLAEKFGALLPSQPHLRAECLSWLFWQVGSAPYLGGGFGHFYAYAPEKIEYPIDRFAMETKRQLDVLDRRLGQAPYLAGEEYTIADIAVFPWYGGLVKGALYGAGEFLSVHEYKNVRRWADTLLARPAVLRGRMVNRTSGDPAGQLLERHDASDFLSKTQDKVAGGTPS